jgi:thiamine pyrophosphate-dependent acetolactate synthase large subunit-like protein
MEVAAAIAQILKQEGVEFLIGYPVNPIIEAAANADYPCRVIRTSIT